MERTTKRVYILVKAFPQPSQRYEETVCCAGISEDGRFLRLYPVTFRHLHQSQRFNRYDLVELELWKATEDPRPESHKVSPESIKIVQRASKLPAEQRVRLWKPFVYSSLTDLRAKNKTTGCTLGIIKPDVGTIEFRKSKPNEESNADQSLVDLASQISLLSERPLQKIPVEYAFSYRFRSAGISHNMKIHDWEVQAAYFNYKRKYGNAAYDKLKHEYQANIPSQNLHFVLGTMKAHPRQFIIIGLLRNEVSPEDLGNQHELFPSRT